MDSHLEKKMNSVTALIQTDQAFRELFAPNGTLLKSGDLIKRERYAETLELIAEKGANVFYNGRIARHLLETIRKHNGTLTMRDFEQYQAKLKEPVIGSYRGRKIITCPLPAR